MKIRPVGADLFHADGQTDMTKLTVAEFYVLLDGKVQNTYRILATNKLKQIFNSTSPPPPPPKNPYTKKTTCFEKTEPKTSNKTKLYRN